MPILLIELRNVNQYHAFFFVPRVLFFPTFWDAPAQNVNSVHIPLLLLVYFILLS